MARICLKHRYWLAIVSIFNAKEGVQLDYPGFFLPTDISIAKTDSPLAYCLQACTEVADSYCSHRCYGGEQYYLTIDNYLGKHTISKEIIVPIEIAENELSLDFEDCNSEIDNYESEKRGRIYATTTYRDTLKEWNDTYVCQRCEETFLLE